MTLSDLEKQNASGNQWKTITYGDILIWRQNSTGIVNEQVLEARLP